MTGRYPFNAGFYDMDELVLLLTNLCAGLLRRLRSPLFFSCLPNLRLAKCHVPFLIHCTFFRDTNHCTTNFTLLPQLMKNNGYATHALGKWDVGFMNRECTATYRGFDTFYVSREMEGSNGQQLNPYLGTFSSNTS